jgi:uncharacterized protein YbaR (Trm112 family)
MATNKTFRDEETGDKQPNKAYYYYRCKGKYEDDGSGGRRRICTGYVFTLESKISYCPVCNQQLWVLESKEEIPGALTIALEKCMGCKNQPRSVAINDERCLGGTRYKDGKTQKVFGTQSCNSCLCETCCKEIIEDVNAITKFGMFAVIKAQAKLRDAVRQVRRDGTVDERTEKIFAEIRGRDAVLDNIGDRAYWRWAMDAWKAVEKEPADDGKGKRGPGPGPMAKTLERAMERSINEKKDMEPP